VVLNQKAVELGRGPKKVIIQTSDDGSHFVNQETLFLNKAADQRINLSAKHELKYFRVLIESHWGDSYIEIDELELYSN
jgi:hypothetical protein